MKYKMDTWVDADNVMHRSVRSYKTLESAKKHMNKWVNELEARKSNGFLNGYNVTLVFNNREIEKIEG